MTVEKALGIYKYIHYTWAIVPALLTLACRLGSSIQWFALAFTLLWIASGLLLNIRKIWPWCVSIMLTFSAWLLPASQTIRRIAFVVRNNALDDENSSPLAFIMGLAFEQIFFFIPLTLLLVFGGMILKKKMQLHHDQSQ